MVEMNDIFANLYKALEKNGQLDNTLIVFTSDNGPEAEVPPHGRTPFRGAKGSTWEGGVRVPTFVYWKGMINRVNLTALSIWRISSLRHWIWRGIRGKSSEFSTENHLYRWCGPDIFLHGNKWSV